MQPLVSSSHVKQRNAFADLCIATGLLGLSVLPPVVYSSQAPGSLDPLGDRHAPNLPIVLWGLPHGVEDFVVAELETVCE